MSNGFLALKEEYIEKWRLDRMTCKTQNLNIEKDVIRYCKLNHNDDELIITNDFCIQFWVKDKEENWKLQQVHEIGLDFNTIYHAEINKSGDFLIFNSLQQIIFFQKSKIDGGWKQINMFPNFCEKFSFIDENRIAFFSQGPSWENYLCISTTKEYPDKLQTFYFDKPGVYGQLTSIFFIESKKILFTFESGSAYFYKQNNDEFQLISIIEISQDPNIRVTCCKNGNFLLIDYEKDNNSRLPSKLKFIKIPSL